MSKEDTAKWLQTECNVTPKMDDAGTDAQDCAFPVPGDGLPEWPDED